jgi:aspartyl-tRNA synthetase
MLRYGSDKPDLRNPIEIVDVTDEFKGSGFGIFARLVESGNVVRAIPAPGAGTKSRKFFDDMNDWARQQGYTGLGYINIKDGEPAARSPRTMARKRPPRLIACSASAPTTACSSPPARKPQAAKLAGLARTRVGEELG